MTDNADYVTILETLDSHKFLVVVMKWHADDEYTQGRVSAALNRQAAQALARSWATTLGVEVR